jgi:hypothetical protein
VSRSSTMRRPCATRCSTGCTRLDCRRAVDDEPFARHRASGAGMTRDVRSPGIPRQETDWPM